MKHEEIIKLNIKNNLIKLRKQYDLKEKDVANALNMKDASTYRSWENGRSSPKSAMLKRIADMYNCSVDFLLAEHEDIEFLTVSSENTYNDKIYGDKYINELSTNERVLIMQIRQLTTSDKNKIVEMIDNMLPNK